MSLRVLSARSLDEALDELGAASADTLVLAGGTDLMVELESGRSAPTRVIDVWALDELRGIREEGGGIRLGALTTCTELERSPLVAERADILARAAREVGALQIKNRATLGGNLGTASPAADLNPVLLALAATVRLRSRGEIRDVPAERFLIGYRETARRPDELIESVLVPPRPPGEQRTFRKVGTRKAQSISKVVLALAVVGDGSEVVSVRAAAGSVAPRTVLLPSLARELVGRPPTSFAIERAARAAVRADISPIDDVRSTAEYRREICFRLLRRFLGELLGTA